MFPFVQSNVLDCIFPVPCVKSHDQLWNEMRMLSGIAHCRQARAGSLALARDGCRIAIWCRMIVVVAGRLIEVALDLFLQQAEIQALQRVGSQAGRVIGFVLGHERDGLQVL